MGGAAAAVGVGVAIMTGGIGAGLAVAGVAAYAGGKTELRGGNMADVATAMGGASLAAGVAGNVVPVLPAVAKAGIGIAGTIGFTVKGVNDARAAGETFSNPEASTKEKILSGLSVAEDIAGLTSSAILAYHGLSDLVGVSNIARSPKIENPDGTSRSVECGNNGNTRRRPTWRESEIDSRADFPEYREQVSFLDGEEVPYGTKESVRPDFYKVGSSVDIKNYDVTTEAGRNRLAHNIATQYHQRLTNLPEGTKQTIQIDIRGQNVSDTILNELYDEIMKLTESGASVIFKTS